jgi:hypothetical protein
MESSEILARATIAAALITSRAVELPTMPPSGDQPGPAGLRLRELTDYVYRLLVTPEPR